MSLKRENFVQNAAARARRLRAKKTPTPAQIEAALALITPLGQNPYERLMAKLDLQKLQHGTHVHQPPEVEE